MFKIYFNSFSFLICIFIQMIYSGPSKLGINLTWLGQPTSNEWIFTDIMKMGSPWYTQDTSGGSFTLNDTSLDLRTDGYPNKMPGGKRIISMIFNRTGGFYPAGTYLFLYDGKGRVFPTWDATITSQAPGRIEVDVTPTVDGIAIYLEDTDPLDPIRNIRFIMPGFHTNYQTQIFHPLFLERWSPFKTIRFMAWQATQTSPNIRWVDRITPAHYTQGSLQGVALEYIIRLANVQLADAWINIPHAADDDYIRHFAQMIKDSLDIQLKVYIEYSNEVWNPSPEYQQHYFAQKLGIDSGFTADSSVASYLYNAYRSNQIFNIFQSVFGSRDRLIRVAATQTGGIPAHTRAMLNFREYYKNVDALAVSNYLMMDYDRFFDGSNYLDSVAALSDSSVFDMAFQLVNSTDSLVSMQRSVAEEFNLPVLAYEAGQHLVPFGDESPSMKSFSAKMLSVNRNPRMVDLYRNMFRGWDKQGGGLFMHFNSTELPAEWGWFGTFEHMQQDTSTAYKYRALLQYLNNTLVRLDTPFTSITEYFKTKKLWSGRSYRLKPFSGKKKVTLYTLDGKNHGTTLLWGNHPVIDLVSFSPAPYFLKWEPADP